MARWEHVQERIIESLRIWIPNGDIEISGSALCRSIPFDDMDDVSLGLRLRIGKHRLYIHWKSTSSSAAILHAIHFLKSDREKDIPIVAVPFMGPTGKKLCENERIGWMDLSGNALIHAPDLLVNISGRPNKYVTRGRKSSVFAPKSSRIIRWMLMNPRASFTNRQLVHDTGVDPGHISRILDRLLKSAYVSRSDTGKYSLHDPKLLLEDWRTAYDFFRQNEVIRGHIPATSSEVLVKQLADGLTPENVPQFAFTGLAAAWQYIHWATFRLVTVYLTSPPDPDLLRVLRFREEPRGANTWLVIPKDEGVFVGSESPSGIRCVSRLQTYLDLKDQPERSAEAAEELYRTLDLGEKSG